jgi:uncharacterized repeat protein (TIGR03803 family)
MANKPEHPTSVLHSSLRVAAFALELVCVLSIFATQPAQAQTLTTLYTFTGGPEGSAPFGGVTLDAAGNIYGTTQFGGYTGGQCAAPGGCGTVYRLKHTGSGWMLTSLYTFHDNDGATPQARVVFGPDGTLFGTTDEGGYQENGVVFNLRPASTVCKTSLCPWMETVLHEFAGNADGCLPGLGDLTFDSAGHIYGTTEDCGNANGAVFELDRQPSGAWLESILYGVDQDGDGEYPLNNVIFDTQGNMYTTTEWSVAGGGNGTVIQMVNTSSGWRGTDLHNFSRASDGGEIFAGPVFDHAGNLYGATFLGGEYNGGTIFELSPSNGGWVFNVIYNFAEGNGPWASMVVDAAGNLYGTTTSGGAHTAGNVFKLTPSAGGWTYTSLYDFTGGSDGSFPVSQVSFDAEGNLYGTTAFGGNVADCNGTGCGTVWEITP